MEWIVALFVVYWQFILAYIAGGALYSIVKWVIQLYRLRNRVLAIDVSNRGNAYPGYSDEEYLRHLRTRCLGSVGLNGAYPPKVSENKSTVFWWAVLWPINLVWTLVADVAKEAWDFLYRKFGALYDKIATAILPK